MKVVWKWGLPAVVVKSTNMQEFAAAATWGPWIRLRPEHWGENVGAHPFVEHEKVHVLQWYLCMFAVWAVLAGLWFTPHFTTVAVPLLFFSLFAHNVFYALFDTYRMWAEIFAYRKALEVQGWQAEVVDIYANALAYDYELEISAMKAKELILKGKK